MNRKMDDALPESVNDINLVNNCIMLSGANQQTFVP